MIVRQSELYTIRVQIDVPHAILQALERVYRRSHGCSAKSTRVRARCFADWRLVQLALSDGTAHLL